MPLAVELHVGPLMVQMLQMGPTYLKEVNVMAIKSLAQHLVLHPPMANDPCYEVLMPLVGIGCKVGIVYGILQISLCFIRSQQQPTSALQTAQSTFSGVCWIVRTPDDSL